MSDLVLYDSAVDALQECKYADEVKGWVDRAAATQAYARMAQNKSLEVDAAEIRIRAERRLGEMLAEQKSSGNMAKGHKFAGGTQTEPPASPTLAEVGIPKKLSARSQEIAAVPKAEFEAEVKDWRANVEAEGVRVTARLESKGKAAIKRKSDPKPSIEPEKQEEPAENNDAERLADMASDYEALSRIVEADDKLAESVLIIKELRAKYEQLNRLYDAQRIELSTMTREAKRWRRKAEAK